MSETHELEALFPETQTLLVNDREVDVSPLKIGEVPRVLKALRGVALPMDGEGVDVLALLSGEHGEAALEAVRIACRVEREWLDALPVDTAIQLAFRVVEVNADFFVRRVLPALTAGMEKLPQAIGPT